MLGAINRGTRWLGNPGLGRARRNVLLWQRLPGHASVAKQIGRVPYCSRFWVGPVRASPRRFASAQDTVRLWCRDFACGGVDALRASIAPGPPPVKSEAALRVAAPLLEEPVADRPNWTIPHPCAEIGFAPRSRRVRACVSAVRSCPRRCGKKVSLATAPAHAEGAAKRPRGRAHRFGTCNCVSARPKLAILCCSTVTRARH